MNKNANWKYCENMHNQIFFPIFLFVFCFRHHFNKKSVMIKPILASSALGRCYPVTLYLFQNPWQSHKPGLAHVTPLKSLLYLLIQYSSKSLSLKWHQSFSLSISVLTPLAVELCFPEMSFTVIDGIVPFIFFLSISIFTQLFPTLRRRFPQISPPPGPS